MNIVSLYKRSFRHTHFSRFRYRLTNNGLEGPQKFPGLSRNGPQFIGATQDILGHQLFQSEGNLKIKVFHGIKKVRTKINEKPG